MEENKDRIGQIEDLLYDYWPRDVAGVESAAWHLAKLFDQWSGHGPSDGREDPPSAPVLVVEGVTRASHAKGSGHDTSVPGCLTCEALDNPGPRHDAETGGPLELCGVTVAPFRAQCMLTKGHAGEHAAIARSTHEPPTDALTDAVIQAARAVCDVDIPNNAWDANTNAILDALDDLHGAVAAWEDENLSDDDTSHDAPSSFPLAEHGGIRSCARNDIHGPHEYDAMPSHKDEFMHWSCPGLRGSEAKIFPMEEVMASDGPATGKPPGHDVPTEALHRERLGELARQFHEAYEELAPAVGYETRPETRVPWEQVPHANKVLMGAVVGRVCGPLLREIERAKTAATNLAAASVGSASTPLTELEQVTRKLVGHLERDGWCYWCGYRPHHVTDCPVRAVVGVLAALKAPGLAKLAEATHTEVPAATNTVMPTHSGQTAASPSNGGDHGS